MPKPRATAFGFWLCASIGLALGAPGRPEPEPSATPAGATEGSLRRVKAAHARNMAGRGMLLDWAPNEAPLPAWMPRFEEHVEVQGRTLADAAARHLEGFDTVNGPATSAPSVKELRDAADHKPTKGADFGALIAQLLKLGQRLPGAPPPRYFLYLVKRGESQEPLLREGRLPAEVLYGPGVTYEPVGEFARLDEALRATDRLRQKIFAQRLGAPSIP